MKINVLVGKILWMIFLTSCVSTPSQTGDANNNLTTPVATVSLAPVTTTVIVPFPTEIATLPLQDGMVTIEDLMKTNMGCNLPCFWGIIPGVTGWETAEKFLQTIGATVGNIETSPGINYHSVVFENENLTLGDNFGFYEIANTVDTILASGNLFGSTRNVKDFISLWDSYSPKKIITNYGIPSRVLLSSVFAIGYGDNDRRGYILWIFYDHLGLLIRYDGTVADLPIYHICPLFQEEGNITRIDLTLQNPSNSTPLELHDSILAKLSVSRKIIPIEEASGINTEDFYNLFVNEESQSCFDTLREIWKLEQ